MKRETEMVESAPNDHGPNCDNAPWEDLCPQCRAQILLQQREEEGLSRRDNPTGKLERGHPVPLPHQGDA